MSSNYYKELEYYFCEDYNNNIHNLWIKFLSKYKSIPNFAESILKANTTTGLNTSNKIDIQWREKFFGKNDYINTSEKTSFLTYISLSFEDPIIISTYILIILLLVIDCINKGWISGYKDGLSLLISLSIYLVLNAFKGQNSKNKIIEYDKANKEKKCTIIRNKKKCEIANREILVGDILLLKKGDIIEVDGLYLDEKYIEIDESPIFSGENKYKIKLKSSNFQYDNVNNVYINPIIFSGTYVVGGEGSMLVVAVGANLYKNNKMIKEIMLKKSMEEAINDEENEEYKNTYESMINKYENELDEMEEYLTDYGHYKIVISALSEQISSIGSYLYLILAFIIIIKKSVIRLKEGKILMSLEEANIVINSIIIGLIGSIFGMIESLYMNDLIGFLSDAKRMKKNNLIFKYEKYAELAFIDTLIINNPKILEEGEDKNVINIIQNLKNSGINIILLDNNELNSAINIAKNYGIISDYEVEGGKKILKKYNNFIKQNIINIHELPTILDRNTFISLCGEIKKNYTNSGYENLTFSKIENFKKIMTNLKIISNMKTEDKYILINGLRKIGRITAIIGNSIEDLKIMKLTNVSIGYDKDVSILRENYGLILLDNSFSTFWNAYKYSNNLIYKIVSYLNFFISTYLILLLFNVIGALYFRDIPINIIEIIIIIFIVDIVAPNGFIEGNNCSNFLGFEKYGKNIPIISNYSLFNIITTVISRLIILTCIMVKGDIIFDYESDKLLEHNQWNDKNGYQITIIFCVLFFMIIIQLTTNILEINKIYHNFGLNIFVLLMILYGIINYGGRITRTKPLTPNNIYKCFGIASLTIPFDFICKSIYKKFLVQYNRYYI